MPLDSNEDELIRDLLEQADAEAQRESISPFATEGGIVLGCFAGPLLLITLLTVNEFLRPGMGGGSPIFFLYLAAAALVGAVVGSQLFPTFLRRRKEKSTPSSRH